MTTSPFDHPLLRGLLGDAEIAALFSADEEIAQYFLFESALATAAADEGVIPKEAAEAVTAAVFQVDTIALREATARDGVPTVDFVRQLKERVPREYAEHVHFGATSQDLIDTSLILRLSSAINIYEHRLRSLIDTLHALSAKFSGSKLIGRTRMQDAVPIAVSARVETWSLPLARHLERLHDIRPRLLVLQFGGAAGTLDKLGNKGRAVAERMAVLLGLKLPIRSWHSQRDSLAEFASWLSLVSGTLGKVGEDISLMAQNAVGEIVLEGGGASSAMPHKQNPVKAEVLVALARYNATLLGAMHQGLVHEQERSGAAWTLEWLTLPQMAVATGAALRTAAELLGSVKSMGTDHG